jgi:hypothetical protein
MKMRIAGTIIQSIFLLSQVTAAYGEPFRTTVQITGRGPGAYNLRASVEPTQQPPSTPMTATNQPPGPTMSPEEESYRSRSIMLRSVLGETNADMPFGDPDTSGFVNQASDLAPLRQLQRQRALQRAASSSSGSSSSRPSSGSSGSSGRSASSYSSPTYSLLTDGSLGSDLITENAIEEFFGVLPSDVTSALDQLSRHGSPPVTVENDPSVPYAQAFRHGDFNKMRELANSDYVDWNQRIGMLGMAGATALKNLSNPNNTNPTAARDALQKISEDLQYAGQGLDGSKPNDAKLKTICEQISRIWGNISHPPESSHNQ